MIKKKKIWLLIPRKLHTQTYTIPWIFLNTNTKEITFSKVTFHFKSYCWLKQRDFRKGNCRCILFSHQYPFHAHQIRPAWKSGLCRFPQFQELSYDHSWDAVSLWLTGKSTNFCLWFSFKRGREWTIQSGITQSPENTLSFRSKALKRFLNLCTQTQEFEMTDTIRYYCRWKNLTHLCLVRYLQSLPTL